VELAAGSTVSGGLHKRGPFDFSIIEQNQEYLKEDCRRERLLDALTQRAKASDQAVKLAS
jgi:hypothetical protein